MKYKIEKNTVQETLIIPLYARKVCSELYPNLYRDETAVRLRRCAAAEALADNTPAPDSPRAFHTYPD